MMKFLFPKQSKKFAVGELAGGTAGVGVKELHSSSWIKEDLVEAILKEVGE